MPTDRRQHGRDVLTDDQAARVADVFESHRRFVEHVAQQHAFRPDDVPDIVQAVAVNVCLGLNGFRGDSEITTWLHRITVNKARDFYWREYRHQRKVDAMTAAHVEPIEDPDQTAMGGERLAAMQAAIQKLRPVHRAWIQDWLRNQTGEPPVQPTDKPIPEGTWKSRLFRARRELRLLLADDPRFSDL